MRVTDFTRSALAVRRFAREMKRQGYERIEGPWEIHRGSRWREVIIDAKVDPGGKDVWVKTEDRQPCQRDGE